MAMVSNAICRKVFNAFNSVAVEGAEHIDNNLPNCCWPGTPVANRSSMMPHARCMLEAHGALDPNAGVASSVTIFQYDNGPAFLALAFDTPSKAKMGADPAMAPSMSLG